MIAAIRPAAQDDSDAVSALLNELGYRVTPTQIRASLGAMDVTHADPVFVATAKGAIVGVVALHIARWLHLDKPIARVTAMIVQEQYQRRGIGRRLLDHAESFARQAGCGTLELTTAVDCDEAHAFYRGLGFEQTSIRFKKALP